MESRVSDRGPVRVRAVAIVVRDGKVLFLRHRHPDPNREYWVLPGGGVQPGESAQDAVVRELAEEARLSARVVRLVYVTDRPHGVPGPEIAFYFLCHLDGDPVPSGELLHRREYVDEFVFADPAEVAGRRLFPELLRERLPVDVPAGFPGAPLYIVDAR